MKTIVLLLVFTSLASAAQDPADPYGPMIMGQPATQPTTAPRSASLQMKIDTLMRSCRDSLQFPERQTDNVMRQKTAKAEQIRQLADFWALRLGVCFWQPATFRPAKR